MAKEAPIDVPALRVSESPEIFVSVLSGRWLLRHSTPSLRREDPEDGFNRIVNQTRAQQIARTVLEEKRAFPNAIVLATKRKRLEYNASTATLRMPATVSFLVVDGQHRLWAQKYSDEEGRYPCVIHVDRTPAQMAELFLEINDKQRRVPSSLRWDLYRLVRGDQDHAKIMTSDIIWELTTRSESPFQAVEAEYEDVKIDLTGEAKMRGQADDSAGTWIKQGSLAPEIKTLIDRTRSKGIDDIEAYVDLFINFFAAIRSLDTSGWRAGTSPYLKARVMRAMVRVLSDLALEAKSFEELTADSLLDRFRAIDTATITGDAVRRIQGSAGVADLYKELRKQIDA